MAIGLAIGYLAVRDLTVVYLTSGFCAIIRNVVVVVVGGFNFEFRGDLLVLLVCLDVEVCEEDDKDGRVEYEAKGDNPAKKRELLVISS